ncbi:VOC family protein [Labrys monachus]|uniref:Catechol 2,3-dioxygenase-like lactoylglutathione lyase family enzyme n=1 Tax=Labrys monachus TaxID=217067 RepID=A0ABU0FNV1_9HYPH|nr:VOC family protein [Labrys monachus]MDQ0396136.1 catechol 2,3-dioxygenase-like lactoylglutathione lyase family enzyme [Labrys monachus]
MLGSKIAIATLAVKDLAAARRFYEDAVGLETAFVHEPGAIAYKTGDSTLFVYESANAGTNDATAVTWIVGDDMEAVVRSLKDKGVAFEHYDMPGLTVEGDIHVAGDLKLAWFKDPDGNIHGLASG